MMISRGKSSMYAIEQFLNNLQQTIESTQDKELLCKIKTTLKVFVMSEYANWNSCCNQNGKDNIKCHMAMCGNMIRQIDNILAQ